MALPPILKDRLRLPVVASPMFIVSDPKLVLAQCKSGIIGSFPTLNARTQDELCEWLTRIGEDLSKYDADNPDSPSAPFAVNLIVHKSNDRLEQDLATVAAFEIPIVITSLGAREDVNDVVHAYGGIVLHDIINDRFARKAIEKGADGLIAVAAGAGGHTGTQSPFGLIQEIREWFDGPLLLSGSIAHGRSILAAQAAGADLAYVGSAFIATDEANAPDAYKRMVVDSRASDIVYSDLFTGVHGNYLRESIAANGMDPDNLARFDSSETGSGSASAVPNGAKAWRDIWGAGHGIGAVRSASSASALIERLRVEYADARESLLGS